MDYGFPTRFAPEVENAFVGKALELVKKTATPQVNGADEEPLINTNGTLIEVADGREISCVRNATQNVEITPR